LSAVGKPLPSDIARLKNCCTYGSRISALFSTTATASMCPACDTPYPENTVLLYRNVMRKFVLRPLFSIVFGRDPTARKTF
jgi:hypothetical protein